MQASFGAVCVYLKEIPCLSHLNLCWPLLFWHCDFKWPMSLFLFPLYVYPISFFLPEKRQPFENLDKSEN